MTDAQFETVISFLEQSKKAVVELQTVLTAVPAIAPENDGDGELKKCLVLEEWLKNNGITHLERFDAPDSRVSSGIRPNLVATIEGENVERTIWIMAHLDVVPEGELSLWTNDPWKVIEKDGKIYGRGVEDNQQGLCSGVFAALAFVKNNIKPQNTVKLLFVADEEVGSAYGIQYLLREHSLFKKQDIIIIPDGGDEKGESIEVAEKTGFALKLTVKGIQAHGSRPDLGKNACVAAADLALLLNDLENHFNIKDALFESDYSTFQPTKREANVPNINTIPGEDVFYMDCRILPCYELQEIRDEIARRIALTEKKYGVSIECEEERAQKTPATPTDAPVVTELTGALKKLRGIDARPIGIGGGTVGAHLRLEGFNAAVWGTFDERAHMPDEYCILDNVIEDAKVMACIFGGKSS
ncbi:MAG: M20 family metallo-hydrolase [Spirochaetales bacterium]